MKLTRQTVAFCILLVTIVFFTYRNLPKTFFQQDEWWSFGTMIAASQHGGFMRILADLTLESAKVHVVPIATLFQIALFKTFYLSFPGYAFFDIVMHSFNTLLIFFLSRLLLKQNTLSFFAALLFAVASIPHQAVSWFAAAIIVQGATFFSLVSIMLTLLYLKNPSKRWYAYGSSLSLLGALFFNEYPLFLFVYLPLFAFIMTKKFTKSLLVDLAKPLAVTAALYLSIRIIMWFVGKPIVLGQKEVLAQPGLLVYLYRGITTPLRIIAQTFIPQLHLIRVSDLMTRLAYPRFMTADGVPNPFIVESIVLDLISYLVGFIIIAISITVYMRFRRQNDQTLAHALAASLLLIMASSLPFILVPGRAGYTSIYEPRYLYLGSAGASIMLVLWLTSFLRNFFPRSWKSMYFAVALLLIPYVWFHFQGIQKDLATLEKRSAIRKSLLTNVQHDYPRLPERVIFFTQSDRSYYGMPPDEPTLPVQSGFGRMLMIWYQENEKFPGCLYSDLFLHDLIAQGYRYCDNRGFGYFRDYNKLIDSIKSNNIPVKNIIAYSWISNNESFVDITAEVRKKLQRNGFQ
ncbi:MAG: hypothetical protein HZA36_02720 [Parcubacteria group bacterium]|nr:hypothetical protein [Parcubacteria group bacterium]